MHWGYISALGVYKALEDIINDLEDIVICALAYHQCIGVFHNNNYVPPMH